MNFLIPRVLSAPRRFFCSAVRLPSERAAAAAGVELPPHVIELIDSTPVSVDERIQKMLALEKWMKQSGIQLRLPRKVVWWVPELPEELEIEIENAGGPANHPDFLGWEGSVPLFKGSAPLAFRSLRARIGSDGPPCSEEVVQEVFEQYVTNALAVFEANRSSALHTCAELITRRTLNMFIGVFSCAVRATLSSPLQLWTVCWQFFSVCQAVLRSSRNCSGKPPVSAFFCHMPTGLKQ